MTISATSQPLRWGILGAGRILQKIGPAFRLARDVELVAIASRDGARAQTAAAEYGGRRAYASYAELIADPAVDVVFNALHNGLHCEWSIRALEAGKHVLCEKPLACSCTEVEQMFAAARANGRWLMEGLMYRFHPQMAEVQRRIAAGELGRVVHIRACYASRGREENNPRYWTAAGGGALLDIGCYGVSFARLVAQAEPVQVAAHAHFHEPGGVDLTTTAQLEFPHGITAHVLCSFESAGSYYAEILGTEGKLWIPNPWLPPAAVDELRLTRGGQTESIRIETPHFLTPFVREVEHFSECVRANRAPAVVTEADSRLQMQALAAIAAASTRRLIA